MVSLFPRPIPNADWLVCQTNWSRRLVVGIGVVRLSSRLPFLESSTTFTEGQMNKRSAVHSREDSFNRRTTSTNAANAAFRVSEPDFLVKARRLRIVCQCSEKRLRIAGLLRRDSLAVRAAVPRRVPKSFAACGFSNG